VIRKLVADEIREIVRTTPEQRVYDWKTDLDLSSDEKRGEFVKDIAAIANATFHSDGYLIYGVNPANPALFEGMSSSRDDANLQQLVQGKIDPPVQFVYYEIGYAGGHIGIAHVRRSMKRPHIIKANLGRLRDGQIPIRRGSSTGGITHAELVECFYGETSPYIQDVMAQTDAGAADIRARADMMRVLMVQEDRIKREMREAVGLW
jgi:hypothetical protein